MSSFQLIWKYPNIISVGQYVLADLAGFGILILQYRDGLTSKNWRVGEKVCFVNSEIQDIY